MSWNVQSLAGKGYVFWYDLADGSGPDRRPSAADMAINTPDRTLDYLFYSPQLSLLDAHVRQHDTLRISDHLPVVARHLLPTQD